MSTDIFSKVREVLAKCVSSPSYVAMHREVIVDTIDRFREAIKSSLKSLGENLKGVDRKVLSRIVETLTNVLNEANAVAFYASIGDAKRVRDHAERLASLLGSAEAWIYVTATAPEIVEEAYPKFVCPTELEPLECEALFHLTSLDGEAMPRVVAELCRSMGVSQEKALSIISSLARKGYVAYGYSPLLQAQVIRVVKKPSRG